MLAPDSVPVDLDVDRYAMCTRETDALVGELAASESARRRIETDPRSYLLVLAAAALLGIVVGVMS